VKRDTTKAAADVADERLFDNWFDPIETALRAKVRGFIETLVEEELETALSRPRYGRRTEPSAADHADEPIVGHRHGHRMRSLTGTFGPTQIAVPRARIVGKHGKTPEWKSKALRAYQRRTCAVDALIASTYLSGAPGAPGSGGLVRRRRWQGYGQPGLAQGQGRLGCLEFALVG
jgi:putative transposase